MAYSVLPNKPMSKNQKPKITFLFKPDPDLDERFADFVETVLGWSKTETEKEEENSKLRPKTPWFH